MAIFASVSDGLALLVSGAAIVTAARALQLARRRSQPAPAAAAASPTTRPGAHRRNGHANGQERSGGATAAGPATGKPGNGGSQARGSELREQVRAFLVERAGQDCSLVEVSKGVGRSSATVSYALDKLVQAGEVELTSPKPRRYTITAAGAGAHQHTVPTTAPTSAPAAGGNAEPAASPPADQPARRHAAGSARPAAKGGSQARGSELREQVRAFLVERAGQDCSLVQVSKGVGRSSATVSYALDKLVQAGQVAQVSDKPRRYAIAADPSLIPAAAPATVAEATGGGLRGGRRARRGRAAGHGLPPAATLASSTTDAADQPAASHDAGAGAAVAARTRPGRTRDRVTSATAVRARRTTTTSARATKSHEATAVSAKSKPAATTAAI